MRWARDGAVCVTGLLLACLVGALAAPEARGQGILSTVGGGPSVDFVGNLPSYGINRTLGSGTYQTFSRARDFARAVPPQQTSYLAARGITVSLMRSGYQPVRARDLAPGPGLSPLTLIRVRSVDSLNFEKRGRFRTLKETTLALVERARQRDDVSPGRLGLGFHQFMFPLMLLDRPEIGYGFFSRTDLVGGGTVDPDVFLAPFTEDVQRSLGEPGFLDLMEGLLAGRPPAKGPSLDQLYDTQLAALGNYLFNNGRYAPAAQAWEVLARRDATNATAQRALGLCLLGARDLRRAAQELRGSLVMAEGWPDTARIVGSNFQDVFSNIDDLADARAELEAQVARQPNDRELGFLVAFLDLFQGRWEEAEKRLAALADADEVAKGLLAIVKRGGVAETVRRPIDSAFRRFTDEMTGLEEPALSPEARAELIEALREGADSYKEHMRIGDFRFFMGEFTLAGESYRSAHKERPEDAFALFAMTHAAYANGEYRQASRYLEQALEIEPSWGLFEFRLQEFYGGAEEYDRHLRNLERQVELRPDSARMRFLLAYVYYFSGRYADATDALAHVLRLEPGFARADHFLRLARLQG